VKLDAGNPQLRDEVRADAIGCNLQQLRGPTRSKGHPADAPRDIEAIALGTRPCVERDDRRRNRRSAPSRHRHGCDACEQR